MAPTAPSATGEPGTPTRCPGCFSDTGGASPCPRCGFDPSAPGPVSALTPGTVLHEQFVIGRVLGKPGGFGITYLALDRALATRVAIKEYLPRDLALRAADGLTIAPHSTEDADTFRFGLSQFLEEARTLARLDHPNIVRVRQFFSAHGSAYLVMDYYQGLSLAEYLARQLDGRLPEAKALGLMQPILDGLRAVHAEGFLHRDIKPANIYLARTQSGGARPILLDFGAARQSVGERSRSLSVLVTDGYAPFEQYSRKGRQGPWTDVYAAAAVLYRVLTGQTPPPAPERIDEDELKPASDFGISQPLSDALALALAVRPEGRPQTVEAWQKALLRDASGTAAATRRPDSAAIDPVTGLRGQPELSKNPASALGKAALRANVPAENAAPRSEAQAKVAPAKNLDNPHEQRLRRLPPDSPATTHRLLERPGHPTRKRARFALLAFALAAGSVATFVVILFDTKETRSGGSTAEIPTSSSGPDSQPVTTPEATGFERCRQDDCRLSIITPANISAEQKEAFQAFDSTERIEIQRWLRQLDYYTGSESDHLDAQVREAIRRFQASRGLDTNGYVDDETFRRLAEDALLTKLRQSASLLNQTPTEALTKQLLVVTMVSERFHYAQFKLDGPFAARVMRNFALSLDPSQLYFLERDINAVLRDPQNVAQSLRDGDSGSFFSLFRSYQESVIKRFDAISVLLTDGFDFSQDEQLALDPENPRWAATPQDLDERWRQRLKNAALNEILEGAVPSAAYRQLWRRFAVTPLIRLAEWSPDEIGYSAINAVASAIDGTGTQYFSPKEAAERDDSLYRQHYGIGAVLETDEETGFASILRVLPEGPAERAGLRDEELIVGIDADNTGYLESTSSNRLQDVVNKLRGDRGTSLRLRVATRKPSGGLAYRELLVTRDAVAPELPSVREIIVTEQPHMHIAVVKLPAFYRDFEAEARGDPDFASSARDLGRILKELQGKDIDGFVLDLRGNGGGSLLEALAVAGLFVESQAIVRVKDSLGKVDSESGDAPPDALYRDPIALLVDNRSAAASEIVAAAVQDTNRGPVLGTRTFGRGTVQTLIELNRYLPSDTQGLGRLRISMAMLFRASGESIQLRGVTPDLLLPYSQDSSAFRRESDHEGALPAEQIAPVDIPDYGFRLPDTLIDRYRERVEEDPLFRIAEQRLARREAAEQQSCWTMNASERRRERQLDEGFERDEATLLDRLMPNQHTAANEHFDDILSRRVEEEAARILVDCIRSGAFPPR
jgi:C-terminal peptidase prc